MIQVKEMTTEHRDSKGMQASKGLKNMTDWLSIQKQDRMTFIAVPDITCTYWSHEGW